MYRQQSLLRFFNKDTIQIVNNQEENTEVKTEHIVNREDDTLICFTDGSCINNGKSNAIGGYGVVWPDNSNYNVSIKLNCKKITNNVAEYYALLHAYHTANTIDPTQKKKLIVYTDSELLIKSMTRWLNDWKRNNWCKSNGKGISNMNLVKKLDSCMSERTTIFRHVKAHTGKNDWESYHNDQADKLAKRSYFKKLK